MSLRDTINGARDEIMSARPKDEEQQDAQDSPKQAGMTRRSVAKAKPAREVASGVRVVSSNGTTKSASAAPQTKAQRRQAKEEHRRAQDRLIMASNALLSRDETYRKRRHIWWVLIGVGLVGTVLSFATMYLTPESASADFKTNMGIVAIVALVLAYGGILGALIYEFVRIRPMRNAMDEKARGMSAKRLDAIIKEDADERRSKESGRHGRRKKTASQGE